LRGHAKAVKTRLSIFLILSSTMVLVDEVIKEGYVFNPSDLINPCITHEKIFVILFALGLYLGIKS